MCWSHGDWSWGPALVMVALSVAFWAFVTWAVLALVRSNRTTGARDPDVDAEQVLARRFAAGEIDENEYRQRLEVLRDARSGHGTPGGRAR